MATKLAYATLAVFAALAMGVVSVGAFDFGRNLKRLMTQPPIIIVIGRQ